MQKADAQAGKRVAAALDKVLAKIQKNQRPDGTWHDGRKTAANDRGLEGLYQNFDL